MTRWANHPLRLARQKAGVSQSALARDAGITRGAVTAIEQGRTRTPKAETLTKIARLVKMQPEDLRAELVAWLAAEANVELTAKARATLALEPRHIAHYTSFTHWRQQIVDSPTAFAILLRLNADVVLRYEHGKQVRGMPDKLSGALMNVLGISEPYLAAVQALPVAR